MGVRYFTKPGDNGGVAVSRGVDFNGDGFDDIIIGAPRANNKYGSVHVVFESASPVDASVFHLGNGLISLNTSLNANNQIGYAVALMRNVSTNTRGILLSSLPSTTGISSVYYLHDLFGSAAPSVAPTVLPTVSPTVSPSGSPTAEPTLTPSARPSASPTVIPSVAPSVVPTNNPTVTPTQGPTFVPSGTPTKSPSVVPSESPTVTPTQTPSYGGGENS
jgi:hypothetical protein